VQKIPPFRVPLKVDFFDDSRVKQWYESFGDKVNRPINIKVTYGIVKLKMKRRAGGRRPGNKVRKSDYYSWEMPRFVGLWTTSRTA
jgi:hypothetical protein